MGQLDDSDLERVADAVREVTGEYPIPREPRLELPWSAWAVIVTVALASIAGVTWSVRADERGKGNEKQIEELRAVQAKAAEAQAKDHDVIVRLEVLIPRLEEAAKRMTEGRR